MEDSIIGSEYLPNVYIEKIIHQPLIRGYRGQVTLTIYDHEERTWSKQESFTKHLKLVLAVSTSSNLTENIENGSVDLLSLYDNLQTIKKPVPLEEKGILTIRNKRYRKFKSVFEVDSRSNLITDLSHLSYFCFCMIDTQELIQSENLDLKYAGSQRYTSTVKGEKVLSSGRPYEEDSNIFYDEQGAPWTGPVHMMDDGTWMAGSNHSSGVGKILSKQSIKNNKIHFLEGASLEIPSVQTRKRKAVSVNRVGKLYHQEEFVEDNKRNTSNTTIIDMAAVLLQESSAGAIMNKYDQKAFIAIAERSNIKNLEVNRYPIVSRRGTNSYGLVHYHTDYSKPSLVARSNNNSGIVKNKILYKISPREIVSIDPNNIVSDKKLVFFNGKQVTKEMISNAKKIGEVSHTNLSMSPVLRPVTFTDYSIKEAKSGRYKYEIKISTRDEPQLYCEQMLKNLNMYAHKLQNLYNVLIVKNVFDGDRFSYQFLSEFYAQYNVDVNSETGMIAGSFRTPELLSSYLIKAFTELASAEKLMGAMPRATKMVNNLNLFSTDLERISNTIEYYNSTIERFKKTYDLHDGSNYEKSSSKSRKDRGVIEKKIILNKTYERKLIKPVGVNFIALNKTKGVPAVGLDMFGKRAEKEMKKFFPGLISKENSAVKNLPSETREVFTNLQENRYRDFTPAKIFFAEKEVETTEINPTSFDTEFFNSLRVVRSAVMNFEKTETQEILDPINDIDLEKEEKYLDSRQYLGTENSFNRLLVGALLRKPKKISKIRNKFKFLDNKILKATKKRISLDTFDISKPNNIILENTKMSDVPLQFKALSLLKTPMTNFDLEKIDFDPLSNPQTQEVFEQNYLNIGKIEALIGFEKKNGKMMMDKPIYKEINPKLFGEFKNKNVLCRIVQRSYAGISSEQDFYNIHDKVFVLKSTDNDKINSEKTTYSDEEVQIDMNQEVAPETRYEELGPPVPEAEEYVSPDPSSVFPIDYSNLTLVQNTDMFNVTSVFALQRNTSRARRAAVSGPDATYTPPTTSGTGY